MESVLTLILETFRLTLFLRIPVRMLFLQLVMQSKHPQFERHIRPPYCRQEGDAVMSCLMEQLSRGSPAMTKECGEVLMQIHYFLARFGLT